MDFTITNNNFPGIGVFALAALILFTASCSTSQKTTGTKDTKEISFSTPKDFDESEYYDPDKINSADGETLNFSKPKFTSGLLSLYKYLEYPKRARDRNISGRVTSRVYLNEEGDVDHVKILRSPHKILSEAAIKAILQVSFLPATLNGQNVKSIYIAPVSFRIQ